MADLDAVPYLYHIVVDTLTTGDFTIFNEVCDFTNVKTRQNSEFCLLPEPYNTLNLKNINSIHTHTHKFEQSHF